MPNRGGPLGFGILPGHTISSSIRKRLGDVDDLLHEGRVNVRRARTQLSTVAGTGPQGPTLNPAHRDQLRRLQNDLSTALKTLHDVQQEVQHLEPQILMNLRGV